jgi:hypothetical protein
MSNERGLPIGWYVFLLLVLLTGLGLVCIHLPIPRAVSSLSKSVRSDAWWRLLGILFIAIAVSHLVVYSCLCLMRNLFRLQGTLDRRNLWPPAVVGVLESVMYPAALLLNAKEFIGFWVLVKVAGQWPRWGLRPGDSGQDSEALDEGRRRYFHFLIGNALQILLGLATYGILRVCALA